MTQSRVLQPEVAIETNPETGKEWVVVRRRTSPSDAVELTQQSMPEPAPEQANDSRDTTPTDRPPSRMEIMRRATSGLGGTGASEPRSTRRSTRKPAPAAPAYDIEDTPIQDWAEDQEDYAVSPEPDVTRLDTTDTDADVDLDWDYDAEDAIDLEQDADDIVDDAPFELGVEHAVPAVVAPRRKTQKDENVWQKLPRVAVGARVNGQPAERNMPSLIEYFRADPIAKGFDLLRTRLVRTIRAYGWTKIAIVSPTAGCGATFTAVNLALSLSRVPGSKTVLMDMNQRAPGIATALGIRHPNRLDDFLLGEADATEYLVRPSNTLAVGLADAPNHLASEFLHNPLTSVVLDDMTEALNPDLVIYDLPPMLAHDDLAAFLPQVDGVLLVADGTKTTPDHITACERVLEGQTQLLGVVLNRGRADGDVEVMV